METAARAEPHGPGILPGAGGGFKDGIGRDAFAGVRELYP